MTKKSKKKAMSTKAKTKPKTTGRLPKLKGGSKRPKQTEIPGTERVVHADVREAAESYVEVRDERQELTQKEVEAKSELMALMKKHDLKTYTDVDAQIVVEIVATEETVKVRPLKKSKAERLAEAATP